MLGDEVVVGEIEKVDLRSWEGLSGSVEKGVSDGVLG